MGPAPLFLNPGNLKSINKVAILGGGLLGGSLALRLEGRTRYSLWARREASVAEAHGLGIVGATASLSEAVAEADLVVLSVPVGAMPGLLGQAMAAGLPASALVTDVGSVKRVVHQSMKAVIEHAGLRFIGGHPMAGSESRGVTAARADLFDGAACLLTDDEQVGECWTRALENFWVDVGCRVRWMNSEDHDALVARISHFPHVMAAATADVALVNPADARYGGGGLRDTTRVAGGDAAMWAEILLENRGAVASSLRAVVGSLGDVLAMLEKGDHEALLAWLEDTQGRYLLARAAKQDEASRSHE